MCVEVIELPLVALHSLEHQLHHLLAVPRAPLVWTGGKEVGKPGERPRLFSQEKTHQCYERSEHMRAVQTSGLLSKFAEQLHGLSFAGNKDGKREFRCEVTTSTSFMVYVLSFQCVKIYLLRSLTAVEQPFMTNNYIHRFKKKKKLALCLQLPGGSDALREIPD